MTEVFLNLLYLCLILTIFLIYSFLLFKFAARRRFAENLEKAWIIIFLLSMMGVTFFPFTKLNPNALSGIDLTPTGAISQLGIYAYVVFILNSRFHCFFSNALLIFKSPFLGFLLIIATFSAFWSITPDITLKASIVLLGTVTYATHISNQFNWQEIVSLWRWSSTIIALASVPVAMFIPSMGVNATKAGWQGVLGHPNPLGALMALNTILWCVYTDDRPQHRGMSISLAIVSFTVMIFAHSGGAICISITLLSLLVLLRFLRRFSLPYAFIILIVFTIVGGYATFFVAEKLELILNALGKDLTLTGRTEFWPKVVEAITKRPLFGYGYKGFWQPWQGTSNPAIWITTKAGWVAPHSHNGFLDLTIDLGLIGLLSFILSFLQNVVRGLLYMSRNRLSESTLPLIILIFLVIKNISETGLWGLTLDFFLYVLVTVRLSIDAAKNSFSSLEDA